MGIMFHSCSFNQILCLAILSKRPNCDQNTQVIRLYGNGRSLQLFTKYDEIETLSITYI